MQHASSGQLLENCMHARGLFIHACPVCMHAMHGVNAESKQGDAIKVKMSLFFLFPSYDVRRKKSHKKGITKTAAALRTQAACAYVHRKKIFVPLVNL